MLDSRPEHLMTFTVFLLAPLFVADTPTATNIEARAVAFVEAFTKGDFEAATNDFTDAMKKALPSDKFEALAKALQGQVGKFKKQGKVRQEKQPPYDLVFVTCEFEKATLEAKLVFDKEGRISGLNFVPPQSTAPPPYARKESFTESGVTIGSGEWRLPGTLTMPKGGGPFPAVVLVHGSGPQDRDETIGQTKPFRDIAWGLASRGIAVIRYEKRTKVHAMKIVALSQFTVKEETIDDAVAAAALLRKTPGIDAKRVFIVGHSLGAMMAPRIALADHDLAGIVLLAAPSRTLVDVLLEQTERELKTATQDGQKQLLTTLQTIARKLKNREITDATPRSELMGIPPGYWLEFRDYKAPADAAQVKVPMLILQGEADDQVTMEDFVGWKMAAANWKNATLKSYPKLNHEFVDMTATTKFVLGEVVTDVADWIKKQ
jgi:dienelactone hydrolase